jgi:hypothetical protein
MGWKEVRVHLLASGAQPVKSRIMGAIDGMGDQVQSVSYEVVRARDLPLLQDAIKALESRSFRVEEKGESFVILSKGTTKATITAAPSSLTRIVELELEFECTARSDKDISDWSALSDFLAEELSLSPLNRNALIAYESSEIAIRSSRTWQEFSERYRWGDP